jgi:hypothetical protein
MAWRDHLSQRLPPDVQFAKVVFSVTGLGRDRLDEIDDLTAHIGTFNFGKCPYQLSPFGAAQEVGHLERSLALGKAFDRFSDRLPGHVIKEKLYGHVQNAGHVKQPAGTDPVGSLFVLLYLLKGQIKVFTKLFLTHADKHASHAQTASNMNIYRIWHLRCHYYLFFFYGRIRDFALASNGFMSARLATAV